jgi:hypothetical protein
MFESCRDRQPSHCLLLIIGKNTELGIQVRISKPSEVGIGPPADVPGSKLSMIFTLLTAS